MPLRKNWILGRKPINGSVTQLSYAKRGIVTQEMEYIAIRENQKNNKNSIKLHLFTKYTKLNINISSLFSSFIIIDIYEL